MSSFKTQHNLQWKITLYNGGKLKDVIDYGFRQLLALSIDFRTG